MATRNTEGHKKRKRNFSWLFVFFVANEARRRAAVLRNRRMAAS